jgi:hypothetical protein
MRGDSFSMSIENLPDSPMGSRKKKMQIRKVFDKMTEWVTPWRSNLESPREMMILRGDVEQDEFQYASSHCLSSYYSVFVVRLAIMVRFPSASLHFFL